jgi:hypothetical protein
VNAGTDIVFNWTKQQIETCRKSHHDCITPRKSILPDRTIALGTYNANTSSYQAWLESDVTLHESTGTQAAYAALSHCWGKDQPLRLLESNMGDLKAGIEFSTLRKAFRHAILYARKMGIAYLWIDSLARLLCSSESDYANLFPQCIIQDNKQDWYVQSGKMASIYESATITIAAAVHDTETDCFAEPSLMAQGYVTNGQVQIPGRGHDEEIDRLIQTASATNPVVFVVGVTSHEYPSNKPHEEIPLLHRGWVYQERLLSPRVIYFGNTDVIFECNSSMNCYCNLRDHQQDWSPFSAVKTEHARILRPGTRLRDVEARWENIVQEYSRLDLTIKSDRLAAIAGVAKQFARLLPNQTYMSGLWDIFIVHGMTWSTPTSSTRDVDSLNPGHPSWSWVSVSGHITYYFDNFLPMAKVQQITWEHERDQGCDGDDFTVPRPCAITLLGLYMEVNLRVIIRPGRHHTFELCARCALLLYLDFAPHALDLESEWRLYEAADVRYDDQVLGMRQLEEKVGLFFMGASQMQGGRRDARDVYLVVRRQDPVLQTYKRIGVAYESTLNRLTNRYADVLREQAIVVV